MEPKTLNDGFEFAIEHGLTKRETEILILFLERPRTTLEVAAILKANANPVHHTIQRLKIKKILILKNRNSSGTCLYKFNDEL